MSADPLADPLASAVPGGSLSGAGVTSPSLSGAGGRFLSDIVVGLGFVDPDWPGGRPRGATGYTPSGAPRIGRDHRGPAVAALAERYGLDHIDLSEFAVDDSAAGLLREHAARRYQAVPMGFTDEGTLIVAVSEPADSLGLTDIAVMTKLAVRPAVASRSQIDGCSTRSASWRSRSSRDRRRSGRDRSPRGGGERRGHPGDPNAPLPRRPRLFPTAAWELERGSPRPRRRSPTPAPSTRARWPSSAAHTTRPSARPARRPTARSRRPRQSTTGARGPKGGAELALADERARRTAELESERGRTGSAIDAERERQQKEPRRCAYGAGRCSRTSAPPRQRSWSASVSATSKCSPRSRPGAPRARAGGGPAGERARSRDGQACRRDRGRASPRGTEAGRRPGRHGARGRGSAGRGRPGPRGAAGANTRGRARRPGREGRRAARPARDRAGSSGGARGPPRRGFRRQQQVAVLEQGSSGPRRVRETRESAARDAEKTPAPPPRRSRRPRRPLRQSSSGSAPRTSRTSGSCAIG